MQVERWALPRTIYSSHEDDVLFTSEGGTLTFWRLSCDAPPTAFRRIRVCETIANVHGYSDNLLIETENENYYLPGNSPGDSANGAEEFLAKESAVRMPVGTRYANWAPRSRPSFQTCPRVDSIADRPQTHQVAWFASRTETHPDGRAMVLLNSKLETTRVLPFVETVKHLFWLDPNTVAAITPSNDRTLLLVVSVLDDASNWRTVLAMPGLADFVVCPSTKDLLVRSKETATWYRWNPGACRYNVFRRLQFPHEITLSKHMFHGHVGTLVGYDRTWDLASYDQRINSFVPSPLPPSVKELFDQAGVVSQTGRKFVTVVSWGTDRFVWIVLVDDLPSAGQVVRMRRFWELESLSMLTLRALAKNFLACMPDDASRRLALVALNQACNLT